MPDSVRTDVLKAIAGDPGFGLDPSKLAELERIARESPNAYEADEAFKRLYGRPLLDTLDERDTRLSRHLTDLYAQRRGVK